VGVTTEPPWVNKTVGVAPRNGTVNHTVNPSTFGDDPFTPTAGTLLVAVVYGGVTHSAAGWTEQLQPVNSGELSVFTKTAAGSDTLALTHNASNYPVGVAIMELPAGSTYVTGVGANLSGTDTPNAVTGLTGGAGNERLIISALGRVASSAGITSASGAWGGSWVEDADLYTVFSSTDGMFLTVGHQINVTTTSSTANVTPTYGGGNTPNDRQGVTFAINAVAPSGGTTPFTKDLVLNWRVLNDITKDVVLNWRVLNALTKDVVLNWRVLNSLVKDVVLNWRVLGSITKDLDIRWRVLNSFTKDTVLNWRVLNTISKDMVLNWRVLGSFTKDLDVQWRVLGSFTKDLELLWRVGDAWQKDLDIQWRVLGPWQTDVDIRWRVLNVFEVDTDLRWRVLGGFTKDLEILWNVLNNEAWQKDLVLLWNVLGAFEKDLVLRWRILSDTPPDPLPAEVTVYLEEGVLANLNADVASVYLP
jgi:hypothetical protein